MNQRYLPCKYDHINDLMRTCFKITKTPEKEWEEIYLDLISNSVCKYVIQKGISRGRYCLKSIKFKDKLYFYQNKYIPLCHKHKYIVESPKYYKKKSGNIKIIPERYKKSKNNYVLQPYIKYKLYDKLVIIDKYEINNNERKLICFYNDNNLCKYLKKQDINIKQTKENKLTIDNIYSKKEIIRHDTRININKNDNRTFICNNFIKNGKDHFCSFPNLMEKFVSSLENRNNKNILKQKEQIFKNGICLKNNNNDLISNKKEVENNFNYYFDNKFKRRKIKHDFLDYKFFFKYSVKEYYIDKLKKDNRNTLNIILKYIINIRNCIYDDNDHYYNNKTYMKILYISDRILDII